MKLVVQTAAREHIESRGGTVYVWAKRQGCCRGRTFSLESATDPPAFEFELIHAADGFQVFTTPGSFSRTSSTSSSASEATASVLEWPGLDRLTRSSQIG